MLNLQNYKTQDRVVAQTFLFVPKYQTGIFNIPVIKFTDQPFPKGIVDIFFWRKSNFKKITLLAITWLSFSTQLFAHDPERLRTLVYEPGARDAGMGGALVAWCQGVEALYYNPAGTINVEKTSLSASFNNGIIFADYFSLSWTRRLNVRRSIGVIYSRSYNGGAIHYDPVEKKSIDSKYYDLTLGLSFAQSINPVFTTGLNAKYIRSVWGSPIIISQTDNVLAFDFGFLMQRSISNVDINTGLAWRNVGPILGNINRKLPSNLNFGVGMKRNFSELGYLLMEVDLTQNFQGYVKGFDFRSGIELSIRELLFFRGGYISKRGEYKYLVSGLGITWKKLSLDLAFAPEQPKLEPETSLIWKIAFTYGH